MSQDRWPASGFETVFLVEDNHNIHQQYHQSTSQSFAIVQDTPTSQGAGGRARHHTLVRRCGLQIWTGFSFQEARQQRPLIECCSPLLQSAIEFKGSSVPVKH